jgi:hypothetical protein
MPAGANHVSRGCRAAAPGNRDLERATEGNDGAADRVRVVVADRVVTPRHCPVSRARTGGQRRSAWAARWLRWAAVGPIAVLLRIGCWVVLAFACTPAVSTLNQQAGVAGPRRAWPYAPGRRQLASRRAGRHPRNQAGTDLRRRQDRLRRTDKTLNREGLTSGPREALRSLMRQGIDPYAGSHSRPTCGVGRPRLGGRARGQAADPAGRPAPQGRT